MTAGAAICIWGTSEAKNTAARERLTGHGGRALALTCDVADEAAVERAFAQTVAAWAASTRASSTPAWPDGARSARSWR